MFLKGNQKESLQLRLWFLIPLTSIMLVTLLLNILLTQQHSTKDINQNVDAVAQHAENLYREGINNSASMLGAVMEVLATDQELRLALAHHDRAKLLQRATPIFGELRKKFAITHLYFSDSNRVNILRAHQPARFGDIINRETTLQAQRNKQTSYGVELGPLGTFTLRLVTPWFDANGHLLGFVELGMEIDHILRVVQHIDRVKIFLLIDKQFINRKEWEDGMRMLGRLPDWENLSELVVNNQAAEEIPVKLAHDLQQHMQTEQIFMEPIMTGASTYQGTFRPLKDVTGRNVGRMAILLDISKALEEAHKISHRSMLMGGIGFLSLFILFYWLLGFVGKQLEQQSQNLREMAEHDGLTGLYNHRMYYRRMDEEFMRGSRTGRPISLLMLDIDHFKLVNDQHGHLAGDMVLKALSELVAHSCRMLDIACRYGGEEITVILPETDKTGALEIAERLRKAVEAYPFEIGDDKDIHITVSIGVSTSSELIKSSRKITDSADHALYLAKERGRNQVVYLDQQYNAN